MSKGEYKLGSTEQEVLQALWGVGRGNVRQVLNEMHARGRNLAYTTVQTMLTRLEQKGFVESDKSGMAYIYRAAVGREEVMRSRVRSVVEQFFDGAAAPLVLQLIQTEKFSADEISELHKLIDKLDSSKQ
ncbi:MAG: BlaI/MecI/CopY family transcriptional regulator [Planctomycetes bacterium]|nr:BlaI/MecI/CopY family transcriptional regulator [Planctomycetota bacterium]